jgi:hypothetical protein
MAFIKEDGSLDMERYESLAPDEWMDAMGKLTQEQVREYLSGMPKSESDGPVQPIVVDYTLEVELERGAVLADGLLRKLRGKCSKNK